MFGRQGFDSVAGDWEVLLMMDLEKNYVLCTVVSCDAGDAASFGARRFECCSGSQVETKPDAVNRRYVHSVEY